MRMCVSVYEYIVSLHVCLCVYSCVSVCIHVRGVCVCVCVYAGGICLSGSPGPALRALALGVPQPTSVRCPHSGLPRSWLLSYHLLVGHPLLG